jgi:hypothetical protein
MQAGALSTERSTVVAALKSAAAATGSDFHYLLGTAMRESSLKPGARSVTSSATGLFQFVDQTWLGLIKNHGARYGRGDLANAIAKGADGRWHAAPAERAAILALRQDPGLSALMAGEYAKSTRDILKNALGREVCGGELYAAHFLGPDAACRLIRMAESDPSASAAAHFPQAASANKSVFYDPSGRPRSVGDVYNWALRQPGSDGSSRLATSAPDIKSAAVVSAAARDAQIEMLLASVIDWQPGGRGGSFFGDGLLAPGGGASALSFNPGLLSLLSQARDG